MTFGSYGNFLTINGCAFQREILKDSPTASGTLYGLPDLNQSFMTEQQQKMGHLQFYFQQGAIPYKFPNYYL